MIKKQDIAAPRTVQDMERRYKFGKTFAETMGLAKEASKAAEKAEETVESLDSEAVFNLLTENGTKGGFFIGNGENGTVEGDIYINAAYIKAGILSGDLIKAGVIQSADGGVKIDLNKGVGNLARGTYVTFAQTDWESFLDNVTEFMSEELNKMQSDTVKDFTIRAVKGGMTAATISLHKYANTHGTQIASARFSWGDGSVGIMSAVPNGDVWEWENLYQPERMVFVSPGTDHASGSLYYSHPESNDLIWVNPQMIAGEEYRTTEFWDGQPVYTQLVWLGYLTGTNKAVNVGVDYTKVIDLKVIAYGSGFATVLPMYGGGNIYAYAFMQGTSVAVSIPRDSSTNYACAVIKYTK